MKRFVVNDWIPAFAGMTLKSNGWRSHSREGGNPALFLRRQGTIKNWIPVSTGMTIIGRKHE